MIFPRVKFMAIYELNCNGYVFGFKKRVQSFAAQFPSPAALLDTSEGRIAGGGQPVIDPQHARFDLLHEPKGAAEIARESVGGQAKRGRSEERRVGNAGR